MSGLRGRAAELSVLWITPHSPSPDSSGGAIRAYELLRGCAEKNRVEVWQTGDGSPHPELQIEPDLWHRYPARESVLALDKVKAVLRPLALPAWSVAQGVTRQAVRSAASAGHDLIVVDQHCAYGMADELKASGLPWVHLEQGIEWRLAASIARRAPTPYGVALNASNAARYWWAERRVVRAASAVVAASEPDASVFKSWGARRVHVAPNGTRLPELPAHTPRPGEGTRLLFLGTLDYWPNVDACTWLAKELLGGVRRQAPEAVLTVIGRQPLARVLDLHDPASGVEVVGEVADVRPWLAKSDMLLVPMRSGHGTKIKMIEAAANGLPMVATRQADIGLDFGAAGAALTAADGADFVRKTVALLHDPDLRRRLSSQGRSVAAGFDWSAIGREFAEWLGGVVPSTRLTGAATE